MSYVIKRLLSLIPVLFVVSIVIFLIVHLTPGNPAATILGIEASKEDIDALNEKLGLNEPIFIQYIQWVSGVLTGDLGTSIFMNMPVTQAIAEHVGPTLALAFLAQIIAILISIPIGIISAYKGGTITDTILMSTSLLGMAIPSFLLALILMLLVGVELQWLPIAGYEPLSAGFWEHYQYLILPAISLGTIQAALISRMTRASMLEVLSLNYIKTARAKGIKEKKVLFKHAFRNAFIPVLTVIAQTFGSLVTGAVVIETIFNIPGLGQLIMNAISRRDFPVIQGVVIFVTILYVLINLVVDLLYSVIDPRIRMGKEKL